MSDCTKDCLICDFCGLCQCKPQHLEDACHCGFDEYVKSGEAGEDSQESGEDDSAGS